MKTRFIVFFIVIAIAVLFAASGVKAVVVDPTLPLSPGVSSPPRECTINIASGKFVKIEAVPDSLSGAFPFSTDCPAGGTGQCLKWTYRWTYSGITGWKALVSVDSDITVLASEPVGAEVSKIIPITAEGERFLTFPVTSQPFIASYYTPLNVTEGTLTAGYVGKIGILPLAGKCALAGADNVISLPSAAVADTQTFTLPDLGCAVSFSVDANNKVIFGTMNASTLSGSSSTCSAEEDPTPLQINTKIPVFTSAANFLIDGSCNYCWINTKGGTSCVWCSSCRVVDGRCVK